MKGPSKLEKLDDLESARAILNIVPRTMRAIRAELRTQAHDKEQLTVPQFRILIHLSESSLNNRQLAEIQGVSVAAMSRMVDVLVRRGLITRDEASGDRRQVCLTLSDNGRATVTKFQTAVQRSMAERIAKLNSGPKRNLAQGLEVLKELFS